MLLSAQELNSPAPQPFRKLPKQPAHVCPVGARRDRQGRSGYSHLTKVEKVLEGCGHLGLPPVVLPSVPRTPGHVPCLTPGLPQELSLRGLFLSAGTVLSHFSKKMLSALITFLLRYDLHATECIFTASRA